MKYSIVYVFPHKDLVVETEVSYQRFIYCLEQLIVDTTYSEPLIWTNKEGEGFARFNVTPKMAEDRYYSFMPDISLFIKLEEDS